MTVETTTKLIQAVETASSSQQLAKAVRALAATADPAAVSTLIQVLGFNNPGAAVAAVDGLIMIGDAAVPSILDNLDDYNYGARAWAIRALAGIGSPQALELLVYAATNDFSQSVRRAAVKGLGSIHWHQLQPEQIQPSQQQALDSLLLATEDGEWVVRYAAVVALQTLAKTSARPEWLEQIKGQFNRLEAEDPEVAVQTRVSWALQQF